MRNFKVVTSPAKDKHELGIVITGDLTIKNVEEFYKRLSEIKYNYRSYHIFLKEIQKIDVSCIQVLIAFMKDLKKKSKEVALTKDLNEEIQKLLQNADLFVNTITVI